ncbi:MAG: thiamine pyrophosphate-dependent dehydrogenase E1 component subunit alpha [Gemmatimonadetes bacterium]|nr:thiamine pyrophosphate-dependent dehydrogenase E1 component subunit alpha [Gemmatimonadota bacterium]
MAKRTVAPDSELVAGLTRRQLQEIYYYLALARAAEERLEILFRQGHVHGGLYRSLGQEGESVACAYALRPRTDGTGDLIAPLIRNTGAIFVMGGTPLEYFRQYLARGAGPSRGRETNIHFTDFARGIIGPVSPLGTMMEVLAGAMLACRMRGEDRVGMIWCGDGQTSTGAWHEGINFAAVQRCPVVVVIEANRWAFSTPTALQTRAKQFVDKAVGYGIAGERVDGNDVIATYEAARRAVDRARAGEGPTLLEAETYRLRGHAQHDAQDYVPADELEQAQARDPVELFRKRLLAAAWATSAELAAVHGRVAREVEQAAQQAVADPYPEAEEACAGIYTDVEIRPPWTRLEAPDPARA